MLVVIIRNKEVNNVRLAHAPNELAYIIDNEELFN